MKIGIIVGHEKERPGASSPYLKNYEYPWNCELAEIISSRTFKHQSKIFFRDKIGVLGAYSESDNYGSDITIELHFNSSHSQNASGTGTLYLQNSKNGKRFGRIIQNNMTSVLSLPEWPSGTGGVVTPFQASGIQRRGEYSLKAGRAPAIIIEPFFGSNPKDSNIAHQKRSDLAEAIAVSTDMYFGENFDAY